SGFDCWAVLLSLQHRRQSPTFDKCSNMEILFAFGVSMVNWKLLLLFCFRGRQRFLRHCHNKCLSSGDVSFRSFAFKRIDEPTALIRHSTSNPGYHTCAVHTIANLVQAMLGAG